MLAKQVERLLGVSRATLYLWRTSDPPKILAKKLPNGRWDYDEKSARAILNRGIPRLNCIYARVSSKKMAEALIAQIDFAKTWCLRNGVKVDAIFSDIGSGLSIDREHFLGLLRQVVEGKVERVVVVSADRVSRFGSNFFRQVCNWHSTEFVTLTPGKDEKVDGVEVFEETREFFGGYAGKKPAPR